MYEALEHIVRTQCVVGECPTWDETTGELYFVDIAGRCYHTMDYTSGTVRTVDVPEMLGCLALCEGGDLLLAMESGIYRRAADGTLALAHQPIALRGARFNDGKIGPDGALYAGTAGGRGEGAFYRLANGELSMLFDGCTCSNGLDWHGDTMFYCDSLDHRVERFRFADGGVTNRRTVLEIPKEDGLPDGMTVDQQGHVWLALWGGWGVVCIDPRENRIVRKIDLPVKQVTSCAFAGEDLQDLIITTAAQGQNTDEQPQAGDIFRVRCDVAGYPTRRYKG